ncbi:MAG: hypothetical protein ACI4PF_00690 [Christensenellales bacterium]
MKNNLLPFFLNLQLFAKEDEDNQDELSLDDFDDEDENEEEETKDDDSSKSEEIAEKEKQSRKKNAEEARKRREKEQKETIEKAKKEAYEKGFQEGKRGALKINSFTGEPLEDEIDIANYELMQKLKDEGKDPIKDFPKAKANLEREKKSNETKAEEKRKEEENLKAQSLEKEKKDRSDFVKAVGSKEKALEIFKDPNFKLFAKGRIGVEPLTTIYNEFEKFKKDISGNIEIPGQPKPGSNGGEDKKSTKKMSTDEHDEYMRRKYHG